MVPSTPTPLMMQLIANPTIDCAKILQRIADQSSTTIILKLINLVLNATTLLEAFTVSSHNLRDKLNVYCA